MNFLNLDKKYRKKNSPYHILPVKYEKNVTYGKGAANGAKAILKASKHLSYYDEQYEIEPFLEGIFTHETLKPGRQTPKNAMEAIAQAYPKQFTVGIGGDHATTIGFIKGLEKHHLDFSVVIIDAHADFYYSWNNSQLNHACVARRIVSKHAVGVIGVRSLDKHEHQAINEEENMHIIKAHDYTQEKVSKLLKHLHHNVYISIDVDAFDPSFIRNTGTPEPGGFFWNDVIEILEMIFKEKKVIGADIVEFAPKQHHEAEAFSLAKLAHKILALKSRYD